MAGGSPTARTATEDRTARTRGSTPDREIIGLVFTQTPRGDNRGTRLERFRELVNLSLEGGGS